MLTNELHARPPTPLRVPAQVSHLALLTGEAAADASRRHVAELCRRYGREEPPPGANCWVIEFDNLRLNWERHTEFSTYTFFRQAPFVEPFRDPVIAQVPCDWLDGLTGEVLLAIHVALESRDAPERSGEDLVGCFTSDYLIGSRISGGRAVAWSDFRLDEEGFSRFLIRDLNLDEFKAGRLVQRLRSTQIAGGVAMISPMNNRGQPRIGEKKGWAKGFQSNPRSLNVRSTQSACCLAISVSRPRAPTSIPNLDSKSREWVSSTRAPSSAAMAAAAANWRSCWRTNPAGSWLRRR